MSSPEREVELAALITFNANDPLNALNDLASSVSNVSSSEVWNSNTLSLDPRFQVMSTRSKVTTILPEIGPPLAAEAHRSYLLRLEEPFETPLKLQQFARLEKKPAVYGREDDLIVFCTITGIEKRRIELASQELGLDLFVVEYTGPFEQESNGDSTHSIADSALDGQQVLEQK